MTATFIHGGKIVEAHGMREANILIDDSRIKALTTDDSSLTAAKSIDASGLLILPGLIDCHVHFREPGLTHKATMKTESAAALAGGVTTVCDMPNTIPPTVTIVALADKVRRAEGLPIDIRFFFGATEPAHLVTLQELWTGTSDELQRLKKRCCGLKLYLDHSTGNQKASLDVIDEAFKLCGQSGIPLVAHCEDPQMNARMLQENTDTSLSAHSTIRSPQSEAKAIEFAIGLAEKYSTPLHIAHLSTKQGIDLVRRAKDRSVTVTCEVAPHHLFLTVDDYARLGTFAKMNPPLRTAEHRDALWQAIADGTVDCIATDHAPHTKGEKISGDPLMAPSGVPGVETMLPLLLTVAADKRPGELSMSDIVRLCFDNPNRIFGLGKKGIEEGSPADLILIDPVREGQIEAKNLHSKCGWTPYEGWRVKGLVVDILRPGKK